MPLVSIVLPTFNRAPTLVRAIESVLQQTFNDFELLIIDDGSTDNTKERIAHFLSDTRVKYVHQENAGASAARNKGIALSSGEFIAFQDSDDEWVDSKLAEQVAVFNSNDDSLSLVYGDMLRINPDGTEDESVAPDVDNGDLFNSQTLQYQVYGIGIQSCLIRKSSLLNVGGFDTKFPRFIDLELFIRLSKCSKFHRIKNVLVKYYATEGISTNPKNAAIARAILIDKYREEVNQYPESLANQYLQIAIYYWKANDKSLTKGYCKKILKIKQAKFTTKLQAIILLVVPRNVGKVILGK